jgi:aspartate racemase
VVVPQADDRTYVNDRYFAELTEGSFREETRTGISAVVDRMTAKVNIEAVILGGTELPLLFRGSGRPSVPILGTTAIHVESAFDWILA